MNAPFHYDRSIVVDEWRRTQRRARASGTPAAFWYLLWTKASFEITRTLRARRAGVPVGFTEARLERARLWARKRAGRATRRFAESEYSRENAL